MNFSLFNKLNYLSETKNLIRNSLVNKGVIINNNDSFYEYPNKILNINSDINFTYGFSYTDVNNKIGKFLINNQFDDISYLFSGSSEKGIPICSDNVINMCYTYNYCSNLLGKLACGNNVINMSGAYYYCSNYKGAPVCGNNVEDMSYTYAYCSNLIGNAICGNKVINMCNAYYYCNSLSSPACSDSVVDMSFAYYGCCNLNTSPIIGNNVEYGYRAYHYCNNLIGNAVFSPKIHIDDSYGALDYYYSYCNNLTGIDIPDTWTNLAGFTSGASYWYRGVPGCSDNIINMDRAYHYCHNLIGSPICGNNVKSMNETYYYCWNLTGNAVFGPNVEYYPGIFNNCYYYCTNLTGINIPDTWTNLNGFAEGAYWYEGSPECSNNVIDMSGMYNYCSSLIGEAVFSSLCYNNGYYDDNFPHSYSSPSILYDCYYECTNLNGVIIPKEWTGMVNFACWCGWYNGTPNCTDNIVNMSNAYTGCYNLIGSPVCGNNVIDMSNAYTGCYNLIGNPVCGPNTTNLYMAYGECSNLEGNLYLYYNGINPVNIVNCFLSRYEEQYNEYTDEYEMYEYPRKRINIWVKPDSKFNNHIYEIKPSGLGFFNIQDYINGIETEYNWEFSDNCYYNSIANIYVYYNLV